jgi:DnaJ domain
MVRFSSSFLTTAAGVLGLTASSLTMMPHGVNAASLTPPPKSKYPAPSMAYPASGPLKATAPVEGDDSLNTLFNNLNTLFNNLNDAWTQFQIDGSVTDFNIINDQLEQTMKEAYHQLVQDSADTIYSSAQTSSDLLRAVLAPALQPVPTPSPLDLRVDPDHWPITTYLIAKMIDPAYNEHATHAYVDPCNLSPYDLGLFYGLFFADHFLQSSHAPVCLPRTDTSVNIWYAPRQFITNIMTNDNEQEFYDTFLPMSELKGATSQFGADQLDSFMQWLYNDLPTVVTHWLFNKIESTKKRLIQFGWPLVTTLREYCFSMTTAMIESFGKARDGLVAFPRDWYMKVTEYSCGVITTLVKAWDQAVVSIRRWITTMRMDKYGSHRAADTAVNGGGSPTMSPDDRQETNVKQVLDAVKRGGWYVHYHVLGIDSWNATPDQIKKAFNKRALWVHPDLNTAHGSHEAMRAVNAAHQALSWGCGYGMDTALLRGAAGQCIWNCGYPYFRKVVDVFSNYVRIVVWVHTEGSVKDVCIRSAASEMEWHCTKAPNEMALIFVLVVIPWFCLVVLVFVAVVEFDFMVGIWIWLFFLILLRRATLWSIWNRYCGRCCGSISPY